MNCYARPDAVGEHHLVVGAVKGQEAVADSPMCPCDTFLVVPCAVAQTFLIGNMDMSPSFLLLSPECSVVIGAIINKHG